MPKFAARRICVVRLSALGDTIHALALVNGLRRGFPNAHITWILQPLPYEIVKHQPDVDEFKVFDPRGGLGAWWHLTRWLRANPFDLALFPQVSAKVGLIGLWVKAPIKLGFDLARSRELHGLMINHRLPSRKPQHVQDQFFEFLDYLGVDHGPAQWNLTFTPDEHRWRERFLTGLGRPAVAFVVASSNPHKDWSPRGYARVMDYVDGTLGMCPLIVGGTSRRERRVAASIVQACRCTPRVALEGPVRRTLLQLSGAQVVVSPDTGPLHSAVALNVPTVGLYG
ncbi:MAG: glycosyltransferase family 9 protein, partial [Desulfobacterales bacterium]